MDILTINDRPGIYPASFYAATASIPEARPEAAGDIAADVCVVGGGFTGLSAALHLARAGYSTVLIEASRIGFGASGRNGGQVGTGQRLEQDELEKLVGPERARRLWDMSLEAVQLVRDLIAHAGEDCWLREGIIHANHRNRYSSHARAYAELLETRYGYDKLTYLDRAAISAEIGTSDYFSGVLDRGGFHIHPLRYALALGELAASAGVRIHENTRMQSFEEIGGRVQVKTGQAMISADHLVLGLNGYHNNLVSGTRTRVMPINNFIAATAPLGKERAKSLIANNHAVADSRFVINYYRLSPDHRLLFGGGESYGYRFPADLKQKVRGPMLGVFPQLHDVDIDFAWGGTLGITMNRLPHFARLGKSTLSMSGFSGHGVALATLAGKLAAEAIRGRAERFDLMAELPTPAFPGGTLMRAPLLALAMLWYAMRDRL